MMKTTKIYYQLDSEERKAIAQLANELAIKDATVAYWQPLFVMIENIVSKGEEVPSEITKVRNLDKREWEYYQDGKKLENYNPVILGYNAAREAERAVEEEDATDRSEKYNPNVM